jgi:hypothetical protein
LSLTLLALVAGLTWLLLPRQGDGITAENYVRIHEDMTEAEVGAILGCPAGNYTGKQAETLEREQELICALNDVVLHNRSIPKLPSDEPLVPRLWVGDGLAVLVFFRGGRVESRETQSVADQPVAWLDRLRRLLPW